MIAVLETQDVARAIERIDKGHGLGCGGVKNNH
jgi:hypothetical protein